MHSGKYFATYDISGSNLNAKDSKNAIANNLIRSNLNKKTCKAINSSNSSAKNNKSTIATNVRQSNFSKKTHNANKIST